MIYVKSVLAGILALVISLTVWLVVVNLDILVPALTSAANTPAPPSAPPQAAFPASPSNNAVTFEVSSTTTTTPLWAVLGVALPIFALGFFWEFRRVRRQRMTKLFSVN